MPNRFAAEGKCKTCGSSDFVAPDNATDESWITCDDCGQVIMTWKEFKTGALEVASADFVTRHEKARSRESGMNIAPLQWDPQLAAAAASYAPTLASLGYLRHSPRQIRPGQRGNLWMGTRGHYSPEQMVASWIAERSEFRPGIFPNVSRTGNWEDVAHYTQVIARETTRVGCAIQPAGQWDFLICRYSPPGNVNGRSLP